MTTLPPAFDAGEGAGLSPAPILHVLYILHMLRTFVSTDSKGRMTTWEWQETAATKAAVADFWARFPEANNPKRYR